MLAQTLLLILGFLILIKGADWLVNGSVSLAKKYRVSELAIGLTIVAFGTSAPELVVNIIASVDSLNDITMGNIVGSNLFNLLCILGIAGIVYPISVKSMTIWREIPLSIGTVILLYLLSNFNFFQNDPKSLSRIDGVLLLISFGGFLLYIFRNMRVDKISPESDYKTFKGGWAGLIVVAGLMALILGSELVVNNAVKIAGYLGASEKLIGITIISVGTSLPELVTSVVAAYRRRSDIAIGNIIGSNIFNILFILGVSALIHPIAFNLSFNQDIILLIGSTLLLFIFMFSGERYRLDRWESGILLLVYSVYIIYLLL